MAIPTSQEVSTPHHKVEEKGGLERKFTVTNLMQQGLRPARVCLPNSSSLNQKNLSSGIGMRCKYVMNCI